jgi:hypothetical protein
MVEIKNLQALSDMPFLPENPMQLEIGYRIGIFVRRSALDLKRIAVVSS